MKGMPAGDVAVEVVGEKPHQETCSMSGRETQNWSCTNRTYSQKVIWNIVGRF